MAKADANVIIGADGSAFSNTLKRLQRDTDTMANSVTARLARLGQAFQALTGLGSLIKGIGLGIVDAAKAVVAPAAAAETLALKFEVMLGSEEETLKFMERLNQYAAETPFALDEISDAAKVMLANTSMGADEVMVQLERIGDLSAMTGAKMSELARVYAKAFNVGLTNEVAESLETMGIPIRRTIAELQGISFEEVFDKISKRQLSIVHLNAALEMLTGTGGKFEGATKRLSQTFEGLASTLGDNVNAALRTFGEQLLPQVKPILEKLITLVGEAMPSVERLGIMFGSWLGEKMSDDVMPALDELILRLPELGVQMEYALAKAQEFADSLLAIPNAIGGMWSAFDHFSERFSSWVNYDMDWEEAGRHATRKQEADSPERNRARRLADIRKERQELQAWAEQQRKQRVTEARQRDAARAAENAASEKRRKQLAEEKKAEMAADEAKRKAAEEQKKREEANQQRWENYQDRRRNYERAAEKKAHDALSIGQQERNLKREGKALGVEGEMSPESIRARLDVLAKAGAKSNEREIAALERLLEMWDALTERKAKYAASRKENAAELRISAMEAMGNQRGADKLREQLTMAKRVAELQQSGYSEKAAKRQAGMERKVAQAQAQRDKVQNARAGFIQGGHAAVGGGGVSHRIGGSQLAESKKHTKIMQDIHNWLRAQKGKGVVAVLG